MFSEANAKKGVTFPKGFRAAGVRAGIKKSGNLDVALIVSDTPAAVAGVFTQNAVAAAPVYVSKEAVGNGTAQAIVANAGCANACTGDEGMKNARQMAQTAAKALDLKTEDVIVASTGVIGVQLPMDRMVSGIETAVSELSEDGSENAGKAIITTDTYSKACAYETIIGGVPVRFGAIAKGSGMISPNMATMLAFITTDVAIDAALLQEALSDIVEVSFNMISVDGDMSTNDMVAVLANGAAGNPVIREKGADYDAVYAALLEISQGLSKRIAADGEGATKTLTIHVKGAQDFYDAKMIGMSVAKSPLVKTAFFGEDPNWGRVICAVGYAGVPMDPNVVKVSFGGVPVYEHGMGVTGNEEALRMAMQAREVDIDIDMASGDAEATVWTCDFSYEYVKINGEYHT